MAWCFRGPGKVDMKKKSLILEELIIWLRGRFSLTHEEKVWILLVLCIAWTGLAARYFYLRKSMDVQPVLPSGPVLSADSFGAEPDGGPDTGISAETDGIKK